MSDKIVITIGNPNGIGPEVCGKALKRLSNEELDKFILVCDENSFGFYFKDFSEMYFKNIFPDDGASQKFNVNPGEKSVISGLMSYLYLEKAMEILKKGEAGAIVTAPVSKELIVNAGMYDFIDHTTFFAKQFGIADYNMMFYSQDLKVVLTTIHIPISEVCGNITKEKVRSSVKNGLDFCMRYNNRNTADNSLSGSSRKSFKIAVCGLNPHAGENGLIGTEDRDIIKPVVDEYKNNGFEVDGPLPADSVFYKAHAGHYDLVVAMYHDQALAPFKLLHFMDGVNLTLGLPVVRTSPDHGTAFDIAGKGIADENSMFNAIQLAKRLVK